MASTFHPFSRLPQELRHTIWLHTEPKDSNVIHVHMRHHSDRKQGVYDQRLALCESGELQYGTKPWPALQSCHEAREASHRAFIPPTSVQAPPPPWLNWETTTLVCKQFDLTYVMGSAVGDAVVNLTLPDCCLFGMSYYSGYSPVLILRHELPRLETVLIVPNSTVFWETYDRITYFEMMWFDLMKRICFGSYGEDEPEVAKFKTRIGHDELPESSWLTSENFLETKYLGCDVVDRRRRETCATPDDCDRSVKELMAPVFQGGRWMLEVAGNTSEIGGGCQHAIVQFPSVSETAGNESSSNLQPSQLCKDRSM